LRSILGEIMYEAEEKSIFKVTDSKSYVSQNSWIRNDTLK